MAPSPELLWIVLAAAAVIVIAAVVLRGTDDQADDGVIVPRHGLRGLADFVADLAIAAGLRVARSAVGIPARTAERDRAVDDVYMEGEIRWRWRTAAEGSGIGWRVWTPSGWTVSVPLVLRVQLRPYTTLTVRLRPGQLISDIIAVQHRLRELMGANAIHIAPLAGDVVTIELW